MSAKTLFQARLKNRTRLDRNGSALLYLIAALLIAGTLGAAIVSLTTTSTLGELGYNTSARARHLAQSGLDYAKTALEADDPAEFRDGGINETIFNLDHGQFILTVEQGTGNRYNIISEGIVQKETDSQARFLVTGEVKITGQGGGQGQGGGN